MMRVAFALLAVAAVALIPASPSIAEVHRPWCADYGHGVNCGFSTYEQCKMTASGTNYLVCAKPMVLAIRSR